MDKIYSRFRLKCPKIICGKIKPHKKLSIAIIAIFIIAYATAITIINSINPMIERQSRILARSTATKFSNEACEIATNGLSYQDLCEVEKDDSGNIKMMKLNIVNVNKITSIISLELQNRLDNQNNTMFNIRLGSFTGNKLLAGRGPNVAIKMTTAGSIETSIKSEFIDAGINQTLHKIYVEIACQISVITPYKDTDEKVTNEVLLAEAVIVGDIPNSYYNLDGLNAEDTLNLLN